MNETWFNISDTSVERLQQINLSCKNNDFSIPYILVYKKRNDVIACIPNTVNDASEGMSTQFVLKELEPLEREYKAGLEP